ncbi:MAG TPA: hypothetical protein VGQ83_42105 [Polyangia bacterium]|jgi:hypothetical protein
MEESLIACWAAFVDTIVPDFTDWRFWVHFVEWLTAWIAILMLTLRVLRNWRMPRQLRETARRLGGPRPSFWRSLNQRCSLRPSLSGAFRGAQVMIEFVKRPTDSMIEYARGPIWIDLRIQAPPEISGQLHRDQIDAELETLATQGAAPAALMRRIGEALWRRHQVTDLGFTGGWARVGIEASWDARELTPERLLAIVEATHDLLQLIADVQRRGPAAPAPVPEPVDCSARQPRRHRTQRRKQTSHATRERRARRALARECL